MEPTEHFWISEVLLSPRDGKHQLNELFMAARKMASNGTKVTFNHQGYTVVIYDPEQQ